MLPELQRLCLEHIRRCEQRGVQVAIVSARRSIADQTTLYKKGRTLQNGVWVKTGKVVTNALPEKSSHCPHVDEKGNVGGAAYDLAVVVDEKPVFEDKSVLADGTAIVSPRVEYTEVIGPQGEAVGLIWGGRWKSIIDMPHFELSGWRSMPLGHGVDSRNHRRGMD